MYGFPWTNQSIHRRNLYSEPNNANILSEPLEAVRPKVVRYDCRLVLEDLRHLVCLRPLRPVGEAAVPVTVGVERVHKVEEVRPHALAGVVILDTVEHLEDVRAVEGA